MRAQQTPQNVGALRDEGIVVKGEVTAEFAEILTTDALRFVADLHRTFDARRRELLEWRRQRQLWLDAGNRPDFLTNTAKVRAGDWSIAALPADLLDRRVEITGPVDRKMVINALNSGANTFMADIEDSHSPTWTGTIQGQINLRDAVDGSIEFTQADGKFYQLGDGPAVLIVRPRGWHLVEKHVEIDGEPASASLFDFGLYLFHNAEKLLSKSTGPYFYLPKLESHLEARLWNEVFLRAQDSLSMRRGTIRATVLIETILAAFEMDEILYELREHSAGLNCGRWDYIFSIIKRFRKHPEFLLPDRAEVTMTSYCMRSYSLLAIQTCHRRGAPAIGGMAAQIPIKSDPKRNEEALLKVRTDKCREACDGHDGTWVAHPGLVQIARDEFDRELDGPNQISRLRDDLEITASDLLTVPHGKITEEGVRTNVRVALVYLASWLDGRGCVPYNHLMEDAATAEISRAQLWQWIQHEHGVLDDGRKVTLQMVRDILAESIDELNGIASPKSSETAAKLFMDIVSEREFEEFLTLRAYEFLD